MRAARFPNHEHNHKHKGMSNMPVTVYEPYSKKKTKDKGSYEVYGNIKKIYERNAEVDFSKMNYSAAPVSKIRGAGIELTSNANDLYPPHMRVFFLFKCV